MTDNPGITFICPRCRCYVYEPGLCADCERDRAEQRSEWQEDEEQEREDEQHDDET